MTSLSERFSQLANTAPTINDPEDEINTETAAQVVDNFDENSDVELNTSQLRKNSSLLLSEIDPRYAGKKVSRNALNGELDSNGSDGDSSGEEEDGDDMDIDSFRAKLKDAEKKDEIENNDYESAGSDIEDQEGYSENSEDSKDDGSADHEEKDSLNEASESDSDGDESVLQH